MIAAAALLLALCCCRPAVAAVGLLQALPDAPGWS